MAASRAAITAASGEGGGDCPLGLAVEIAWQDLLAPHRCGGLGAVGLHRWNRRSRSRDGRRRIGEPVNRRLAEQRIDARLLVEGEQLAGGLSRSGASAQLFYVIAARRETMGSGFPEPSACLEKRRARLICRAAAAVQPGQTPSICSRSDGKHRNLLSPR